MNDQSRAIWGTNHSTKAPCFTCGRKWVYYVKGKFHFSKRCWGFMIFSVLNWESDIKIAWVCAAKCRTEEQSPLVKADIPRQGMQEVEGQFLLWSCRDPTPEPWLWSQPWHVDLVVISSTSNPQERLKEDKNWPYRPFSVLHLLGYGCCGISVTLCHCGEVLGDVSQHRIR